MGNCCPCLLKSEPKHHIRNPSGNYSLSAHKLEESDTYQPSRSEGEDSSFAVSSEAYVNGSSLLEPVAKGDSSTRRPFYALIPPLVGRTSNSSAGDAKRTNNNTISGALTGGGMGNSASSGGEVSESNLAAFYDHYRDAPSSVRTSSQSSSSEASSDHHNHHSSHHHHQPHQQVISAEGILRLCADLDLPADDFRVLLFAWKCDASQMGMLTKQEFLQGCRSLGTDSIRSLKSSLEGLVKEVEQSDDAFGDVYRYAFRFALDVEYGQRSLPVDVAVSLWRLVFTHRPSQLLDRWIEFLEQVPSPVRAIPRDTWCMFLHLVEAVGNDLSRYDDTEAWPSLFDDFVEWANDKANQNVHHSKEESHAT